MRSKNTQTHTYIHTYIDPDTTESLTTVVVVKMRESPPSAIENNNNNNSSSNGSSSPPPPPPQALVERLKDYGQEDAFAFWDQLSSHQQNYLVQEFEVF